MSLKRRAFRAVGWSTTRQVGEQALTFVVYLILARLLDPAAFGLVAMANVFLALVQIFVDQGLADAIIQRDEVETSHLDTAFWSSVLLGGLLALASFLLADVVAALFGEPDLATIVRWLSLNFPLAGLASTQQAILKRDLRFGSLAMRGLAARIGGGVAGVVMALTGFGVWSLVGQSLVSSMVGVITLWRVSDWRPSFRFSWGQFKELFSFGVSVLGNKLLNFLNRRSDNLLIGYFLGPTQLGYYGMAYRQLMIMTQLLIQPASSVAFSTFSRLQAAPGRMRNAFHKATRISSLVAFPGFIGLVLVAPVMIRGLFGAKWVPSIPVVQALAFVGILHSVSFFNPPVIKAVGKPSWTLGLNVINAVVNVTGFLIAVRWGIVAVAVAFVVRGYLLSPLPLLALRKLLRLDLKVYFRQFLEPALATLVMALGVLVMKSLMVQVNSPRIELVVYVVVGAALYLGTIRLINPSLLGEIMTFVRMALPRLPKRKPGA